MFENLFSIGGLSFDRLKSFVDVAEKGSIARVAEGDSSRQSLISRQIGELESFFGIKLVQRKGKGMELTEPGRELARQVRLQFQGLSDFKLACANRPMDYRIAAGNSVLEWLVVGCLGEIASDLKGTYSLLDWRTADIIHGLMDHTVDFGVVRKSALVPSLKFQSLGYLNYRLFVPPSLQPMRLNRPIPLAIATGAEFSEVFGAALANAREEPNIIFRCTSFTQAAQIVRSGTAAAILPHIAARSFDKSVGIYEPAWLRSIRRELGLAWHRRVLDVRPGSEEVRIALVKVLGKNLL